MSALYPPNPAAVPPGLVTPSSAYKRRAWLAVGGLLTFFALYLGLMTWFAYKAYALFSTISGENTFLHAVAGTVSAFFAVFLATGLFFSRGDGPKGRVELKPEDEPALFDFVHRIADGAGAPRPHRVFLSPQVNASVFYDLSLINLFIPTKKNLVIGLGLVNVLTLAEFKAVLAHEFGHFAQRSMAVGRWVYVGQQIAAHVIESRGIIDTFLAGLSSFDLRVAWIGWILRVVVWSLRAVTDSFYRLMALAERALSREMELQADRVSVSLAGSDALIHALYKLNSADQAWDFTMSTTVEQLGKHKRIGDVFAVHSHILEELRRIYGDEEHGPVPPLPQADRDAHRIFTPDLAQPPAMWSTHPPNHERERSAKAIYVEGPLDDRSSWALFADPQTMRMRSTTTLLDVLVGPDETDATEQTDGSEQPSFSVLDANEAVAAADERFDKSYLESQYQGLYLGRAVGRRVEHASALLDEVPADPKEALAQLYPESLGEQVQRVRRLDRDYFQLRALADGIAEAPGGVITYRGRRLARREVKRVVEQVEAERQNAKDALQAEQCRIRSTHLALAREVGQGWPEFHAGLVALLHFAEHIEADVDDAMGHLSNVFDVVIADGRITEKEQLRLLHAGTEVFCALERVWDSRERIQLSDAVAAHLGAEGWQEAFDEPFALVMPTLENLAEWMQVVEGWHSAYSNLTGALRIGTLESLLDAEAHLRRCATEGTDPKAAPRAPIVNATYRRLLEGQERERQTKLKWWDRFMTATGPVASTLRFAASASIVGSLVLVGSSLGSSTIIVHNGLNRDVVVEVGDNIVDVRAGGRAETTLTGEPIVQTRTLAGKLIERFEPEISEGRTYAYSVGGASFVYAWTASYGSSREETFDRRGAPRWFAVDARYVFEDPPETISSNGDGGTRSVITAVDAPHYYDTVGLMGALSEDERIRVASFRATWDPPVASSVWLTVVADADLQAATNLLTRRLEESPDSVPLLRLEQDFAESEHAEVCKRHRLIAAEQPGNLDYQYLSVRCMTEGAEQDDAALARYADHPQHPWFALMAGRAFFSRGENSKSLEAFATARAALPFGLPGAASSEARVRRLNAQFRGAVEFGDLQACSPIVEWQLERDASAPFKKLDAGDLQGALETVSSTEEESELIELVAASEGATPAMRDAALARPIDAIPNVASLLARLIVVREVDPNADTSAIVERALEQLGDQGPSVLEFSDAESLRADLEAANTKLMRLRPELRGLAAVLGIRTLGDDAPQQWRNDARRLLYAHERPYFASPEATSP